MEIWLFVYNDRIYKEPTSLTLEQLKKGVYTKLQNVVWEMGEELAEKAFVEKIREAENRLLETIKNTTPDNFYNYIRRYLVHERGEYLTEKELAELFEEVLRLYRVPYIFQRFKNMPVSLESIELLIQKVVPDLKAKMVEIGKAKSTDEIAYTYFIIPDEEEDPPLNTARSTPRDVLTSLAVPIASFTALGILYLLGKVRRK